MSITPSLAGSLRPQALSILAECDVAQKCRLTTELAHAGAQGCVALDAAQTLHAPAQSPFPGRPALPPLVPPVNVPTRSPYTADGRAALLHAVCHIEFNAVNLALDAVWRFADMPPAYYWDWLRVAGEEVQHFEMLQSLLQQLECPQGHAWRYGSFDAHDGLWAMCDKTAHDVTARMALVPRTLEARGLDATPLIQAKLCQVGTSDALQICTALDTILQDEIGHVAVGNRWYGWLCQRQGLDPLAHYRYLARQHAAPRPKPPFNTHARRLAGFTEEELTRLLA